MVPALLEKLIEEILFHTRPNSLRKKMTKKHYDYLLDGSIQAMLGFLKIQVGSLVASAPAVKKLSKKKVKK